jgi:hypothetical protein
LVAGGRAANCITAAAQKAARPSILFPRECRGSGGETVSDRGSRAGWPGWSRLAGAPQRKRIGRTAALGIGASKCVSLGDTENGRFPVAAKN